MMQTEATPFMWSNDACLQGMEGPSSYNTVNATYADDKTPVIILIHVNKSNAQDKLPFLEHNYLRYFRKIYESKGWTVVPCTPTDNFISKDNCARTVQSVMAYLEIKDLHRNPIFLHLLGPRSVSVYNEFTKVVRLERDDIFQIVGTIIDSGPSRPRGVVVSLRKTFPTLFNLLIAILHIMAVAFPEFFNPPSDMDTFEEFCYNKCPCPQFYLYSTSDHIVDSTDVEFAINIRHQAGVAIERKCWTDTEHARHLFSHEQEYTLLCQDFIERHIKR